MINMTDRTNRRTTPGMNISRRDVLAGVPAAVAWGLVGGAAAPAGRSTGKRPQIAALVTEYRKYSHGECIIDRFLGGYGWESRWHYPQADVISLYVDQFPESDLSRERAARYPNLNLYPTDTRRQSTGRRRGTPDR